MMMFLCVNCNTEHIKTEYSSSVQRQYRHIFPLCNKFFNNFLTTFSYKIKAKTTFTPYHSYE